MKDTSHNKDLIQNNIEDSEKAIVVLDDDGYILSANTASERIFGYKSGALIGRNIKIQKDTEEENLGNINILKEKKLELERYEEELEEKVQDRTHELMNTVKKLVETNLNLEEQLLINKEVQKLALANKVLSLEITKYFPKGLIVVVDKNLIIQFIEGEILDQLGIRKEMHKGICIEGLTLFSKKRNALIKVNYLQTLSGERLSFERSFKKKYYSIETTPLFDENNEIISALHVYHDLTSQKEMEFKFENAFKEEKELNDLKSRFVSLASHEFRTPLSAILIAAGLIGDQNGEGDEHKREKYVAQIERNVKHLDTILNDFLSLSKLEEGKVLAIREQFDIIEFCEVIVKEIKINLKKDQIIKISYSFKKLLVNLDPKLLRHVLMNLLSNAYKYSSEVATIVLKISKNEKYFVIKVIDQGIGIPKEEQKHLFQRFFRAKNAVGIEGTGTGLGLNIVKNYTELMDGEISFKSELNKGSTFSVKFPI